MQNKIRRFTKNQLLVLKVFLQSKTKVVTQNKLEKKTKLKGKSLGGVISSLTRTRFRGNSLIQPAGKATNSNSLRWLLHHTIPKKESLTEVNKLLKLYE
ncbi:hypothetical protein ACFL1M_00945 [Patescibacteria group bacterium]